METHNETKFRTGSALCIGGSWNGRWLDYSNQREKVPVPDGKGSFNWEFYDAMKIRNGTVEWVVFRHESLDEIQALSKLINGYGRNSDNTEVEHE